MVVFLCGVGKGSVGVAFFQAFLRVARSHYCVVFHQPEVDGVGCFLADAFLRRGRLYVLSDDELHLRRVRGALRQSVR